MRIAAIDVGTNTAQLLVAERRNGTLHPLHTAERFVRLGEGVDASGRINEAAMDRLRTALLDHCEAAASWRADHITVGATSASRDAANRDEVITFVRRETGLPYDIISGEEEAAWSFAAACAPFDDLDGPCAVIDVGGGSTELIVGTDPSGHRAYPLDAIDVRRSLDVGTVRLTERLFEHLPPSPDAAWRAEVLIQDALADADVPVPADAPLIATAGTATALALVHAGPGSTADALDDAARTLAASTIADWADRLLALPLDDIMALHPPAMHGRADVFPMGVLLLRAVMQYYDVPALRVSPYELRYGLALRFLARTAKS